MWISAVMHYLHHYHAEVSPGLVNQLKAVIKVKEEEQLRQILTIPCSVIVTIVNQERDHQALL